MAQKYHSMRNAFMAIDKDHSGVISVDELHPLLEPLGFTDEDIAMLIAGYAHTDHGGFRYHDFCSMIEATQLKRVCMCFLCSIFARCSEHILFCSRSGECFLDRMLRLIAVVEVV